MMKERTVEECPVTEAQIDSDAKFAKRAGGYADNEVGAVSCTGDGESIMKVCLAHQIIAYMRMGLTPDEAAKIAVDHMEKRVNGYGGVIVLNNKGEVGKAFTSNNMSWAWARGNKIHYGTKPGEDNEESFSH